MPAVNLPIPIDPMVRERAERLALPFNRYGIDPYGIERKEVARFFTFLGWLYRSYLNVNVHGIEHVPQDGRAMLVGNHSGGVALDGAMVLSSVFFEMEPPRLAQGMAEKFINRLPFASSFLSRVGQFTGLPEHAARLLMDDRLLMVFPEGARGTAKLYRDRDSLVRFGTGFMRLALETNSPIVPTAFVGGGEAIPTVANLYGLGKLIGLPYLPVTPYLLPLPLPVKVELLYSEPMFFEGDGSEPDDVIFGYIEQVKSRIAGLISQGRAVRDEQLDPASLVLDGGAA